MAVWLLRVLVLKFTKGMIARFIILLLALLIVLNFLFVIRGNGRQKVKPYGHQNEKIEKALANELENRLNAGKSSQDESGNLSRRKPKETTVASSSSSLSKTASDKLKESIANKRGQFEHTTINTVREQNKPQMKPLESKNDGIFPQESLENVFQTDQRFSGDKPHPRYVCPELFISQSLNGEIGYGKCKPHRPTLEACIFAEKLYYLDKNSTKCKSSRTEEICNVKIYPEQLKSNIHVQCDRSLCSVERYSSSMAVWTLEPRNGEIEKIKSFFSTFEMEKAIPEIIMESIKREIYFIIIKCSRRKDGELISQLLPIDPRLTIRRHEDSQSPRSKNAVNVNILLVDSVSRSHFYRSLPRTINLFKNWSSSYSAPAHVFDFELFQAIHGHTAENTHALFTGKPTQPHLEDEFPPVEVGAMFGHFAKAGYQTLWQEDLCWKGIWGLMTDINVTNWEDLTYKLRDNFIDSIGITHSSCEVLMSYKIESPFNGPPDDQICYNGKFQHEYLLRYTLDTLGAIRSSSKALPLVSYMSLSVGHDDNGRRIQTLDQSLVEYIDKLGRDENTITVVLADHGNTYTQYTVEILEGRYEMFHPSLFIIVPNNVAKLLGNEAMRALRTNQHRLVNMFDLHYTLMALAGPLDKGRVTPTGVFTPISLNRTCNDMELRTPNLCVCDGWDSPTTNDTLKLALVEFAIGELNNLMDDKYVEGSGGKKNRHPILKSCHRLVPLRFENVRERISKKGLLRTSMDIYIKSVKESPEILEIFHVEIESKETPDSNSMDLTLVHFDRMSVFEKYKTCSDTGVSPVFCICSNTKGRRKLPDYKNKIPISIIKDYLNSFETKASVKNLDQRRCVFLVQRSHQKQSFSLEFLNRCLDVDVSVFVDSDDLQNMKVSRNLPMEIKIPAGSVRFAFTARKDLSYWESNFRFVARIITNKTLAPG